MPVSVCACVWMLTMQPRLACRSALFVAKAKLRFADEKLRSYSPKLAHSHSQYVQNLRKVQPHACT